LTPPPRPRPPAWICAFTTTGYAPSFSAAALASSTVKGDGTVGNRHAVLAEKFFGLVFMNFHGWASFSFIYRVEGNVIGKARRRELVVEYRDGR
jgi:hypothetical protein